METLSSIDQRALPEAYSQDSGVVALPSPATLPASSSAKLTMEVLLAANAGTDFGVASALGVEEGKPFGIFYGLRSVLLLYLGAGIVGAVGYEIWCLLNR